MLSNPMLKAKSTDCRYQVEKSFVVADNKHIRLASRGKKRSLFDKQLDNSDEDELEFLCKEQFAKLLAELEVYLVEKKPGLWQTPAELPVEVKVNSQSIPLPSKGDFVLKRAPSIERVCGTLKRIQCPQCSIELAAMKLMLLRHLGTHINALKKDAVRCPVCILKLCCASSLKRHMIIHTGLKPYSCPQREKCLEQKINLQQHIGEPRHKCHLYKWSSNQVMDLSRHLVTDAGVPFACKECGRLFNGSGSALPSYSRGAFNYILFGSSLS
ncbi:GH12511 [Drosophila grimshawi]|uniref:GH12511 n=1 Tax=Drosophila grimshawi TaxID=7222 RepID=B4JJM0_DROGR|nr:GH12511 [Drosophila grimshawi]